MSADRAPELTVVIASHNRRERLRRCLEALTRQSADPASFEVIVCLDGDGDGSAAMVDGLDVPYELRLLRLEKQGHAAAQNAGLQLASAPLCLLLDDDVVASPDLVAAHVEGHRRHPDAIGVGALTQEPVAAEDWYAHAFARGWLEHYEELAKRDAHWSDCYGANLSFPYKAIRDAGWVSTEIPSAKDFELALRLTGAGLTPVYLPRAHGVHDDQKRSDRMFADARRAGVMHVALSERFPGAAPELLDWSKDASGAELVLRRACLALRVPIAPLAWPGRFLPGDGRKMIWLHFVRRLSFWAGVREEVGRRPWSLLIAGRADAAVAEGLRR